MKNFQFLPCPAPVLALPLKSPRWGGDGNGSSVSLLSLPHKVTLSLSPSAASVAQPLSNPWQKLNQLVIASLTRAHHLKHPKTNISVTKTPLFPLSYGGYSVSLSFGTPPQTLPFVMDTASSLVWFPCTQRYKCSSCNFPNINSANISRFIPKSSSSVKILGCKNSKCGLIYSNLECNQCDQNSTSCTETCPPYIIQYGSGSTGGLLLSETLVFPEKSVDNFMVGCSLFSSRQPSGIAGFGRGPESLPSQMGVKKFSYCLVSHRFDDTPVSSELVLVSGGNSGGANGTVKYTPFRKNPVAFNSAFQDYYYVTLRKMTVGGIRIKVPYKFLVPGSDGHGGTIVDSGSTFTSMDNQVFELVAQEFERQVGKHYPRAADVEKQSGLRPCFNVSGEVTKTLPKLIFEFKGGAKMELPVGDYFSFLDDSVICMTIVTNNAISQGISVGPSIILGNYQQQNFYLEYDLEKERLGFLKQICN
ncbi:Eukaryotic aspartyl protease family protein [Forsythia ovata]|uniref:Eukaryotic aspartyl protease family protein n=1 Tax=Forsythia ovata TaxID=205694 RepID=A0ABD1VJH0_9LAMI